LSLGTLNTRALSNTNSPLNSARFCCVVTVTYLKICNRSARAKPTNNDEPRRRPRQTDDYDDDCTLSRAHLMVDVIPVIKKKGEENCLFKHTSFLCRSTISDIVQCTSTDRRMLDKSALLEEAEGAEQHFSGIGTS
jgi:hypothetical protein